MTKHDPGPQKDDDLQDPPGDPPVVDPVQTQQKANSAPHPSSSTNPSPNPSQAVQARAEAREEKRVGPSPIPSPSLSPSPSPQAGPAAPAGAQPYLAGAPADVQARIGAWFAANPGFSSLSAADQAALLKAAFTGAFPTTTVTESYTPGGKRAQALGADERATRQITETDTSLSWYSMAVSLRKTVSGFQVQQNGSTYWIGPSELQASLKGSPFESLYADYGAKVTPSDFYQDVQSGILQAKKGMPSGTAPGTGTVGPWWAGTDALNNFWVEHGAAQAAWLAANPDYYRNIGVGEMLANMAALQGENNPAVVVKQQPGGAFGGGVSVTVKGANGVQSLYYFPDMAQAHAALSGALIVGTVRGTSYVDASSYGKAVQDYASELASGKSLIMQAGAAGPVYVPISSLGLSPSEKGQYAWSYAQGLPLPVYSVGGKGFLTYSGAESHAEDLQRQYGFEAYRALYGLEAYRAGELGFSETWTVKDPFTGTMLSFSSEAEAQAEVATFQQEMNESFAGVGTVGSLSQLAMARMPGASQQDQAAVLSQVTVTKTYQVKNPYTGQIAAFGTPDAAAAYVASLTAPLGYNAYPQLGVFGTFLTGVSRTSEFFEIDTAKAMGWTRQQTNPALRFAGFFGAELGAIGTSATGVFTFNLEPAVELGSKYPSLIPAEVAGVAVSLYAMAPIFKGFETKVGIMKLGTISQIGARAAYFSALNAGISAIQGQDIVRSAAIGALLGAGGSVASLAAVSLLERLDLLGTGEVPLTGGFRNPQDFLESSQFPQFEEAKFINSAGGVKDVLENSDRFVRDMQENYLLEDMRRPYGGTPPGGFGGSTGGSWPIEPLWSGGGSEPEAEVEVGGGRQSLAQIVKQSAEVAQEADTTLAASSPSIVFAPQTTAEMYSAFNAAVAASALSAEAYMAKSRRRQLAGVYYEVLAYPPGIEPKMKLAPTFVRETGVAVGTTERSQEMEKVAPALSSLSAVIGRQGLDLGQRPGAGLRELNATGLKGLTGLGLRLNLNLGLNQVQQQVQEQTTQQVTTQVVDVATALDVMTAQSPIEGSKGSKTRQVLKVPPPPWAVLLPRGKSKKGGSGLYGFRTLKHPVGSPLEMGRFLFGPPKKRRRRK